MKYVLLLLLFFCVVGCTNVGDIQSYLEGHGFSSIAIENYGESFVGKETFFIATSQTGARILGSVIDNGPFSVFENRYVLNIRETLLKKEVTQD